MFAAMIVPCLVCQEQRLWQRGDICREYRIVVGLFGVKGETANGNGDLIDDLRSRAWYDRDC